MRALLVAIVAAAALAGCASEPDTQPQPTNQPSTPVVELPANITDTRNVVGGLDLLNQPQTGGACVNPPSNCIRYPFTVNATSTNVTYTARLTWTIQANDFDLYLYKDGEQVDISGAAPPGTSEQLRGTLRSGNYEIAVDPYGVVQDTYTLDVTFSSAS